MALEILSDTKAIDHRLDQLAAAGPLAPVTPRTPLLANLSAQENLELVGAFHGNANAKGLATKARNTLARLAIPHCAEQRPAALTDAETLWVQLGRAAMREGALVVVVTPFVQVPELESDLALHQALEALGIEDVRILDLPSHRHRYTRFSEAAP